LIVIAIIGIATLTAYPYFFGPSEGFPFGESLTIEELQKVPGGKIVGMQKNLYLASYRIEVIYQGKVMIYEVTPEMYHKLHTDMDLPLKE